MMRMVDYYLQRKQIKVAVSWDGKKSMVTRGYDVVEDKKESFVRNDDLKAWSAFR